MPDHDDLNLLVTAVRDAGSIALRYFGGEFRRWTKSGGSPVTEADLEVDAFLKNVLTAARPDHGWLSEESADNPERLGKQRIFIVDPIDGTVAFLKGRPHFTICAAIAQDGASVAGAVFNPVTGEMFAAKQGGGATLNGETIRIGAGARLEDARVLGEAAKLVPPAWPDMRVENRNSAAYRLALTAAGAFDATISTTAKRDWDLAAAELICREAGGAVTDRDGAPLRYNRASTAHSSVIAANPVLHADILRRLGAMRQ